MGLFSSVLHLRDIERDRLIPALHIALRAVCFRQESVRTVPTGGPHAMSKRGSAEAAAPSYAVSALNGRWITLIETQGTVSLTDLGRRLSAALSCYALALFIEDDDVFRYDLYHKGKLFDRYNSCPQYYLQQRLPKAEVERQRHSPEPFAALLPPDCTLEEIRSILGEGWWDAHDAGELDRNGVPMGDDGFVSEKERMIDFGTTLQLHGSAGAYPYAAWAIGDIDWPSFLAIRYRSL